MPTIKRTKARPMIDPSTLSKACLMRQSGWTVSAIANRLDVSNSSLNKLFKTHGIVKSLTIVDSLESAKSLLLSDAGFIGDLKEQIASQINDDIAISQQIRASLVTTLELINADVDSDIGMRARSLSALATSLKLTSETMRKALNITDASMASEENIPQLYIHKMTDEQVAIAKGRFANGKEIGDDDEVENDS